MSPLIRTVTLAAAGVTVAAQTAAAAAPPAIRVGGPSAPADAKIALVGSNGDLRGRPFRVLDGGGRVVLRGKLKAASGSAAPWRRLAQADLSRLSRPGSYRVRAAGLSSRPWVVRGDAQRAPIAAILQYFAANADGAEPSPLHGPAHLDDAVIASGPYAGQRFDLTGGWMDAGDMLKFTSTTAYAAAALQAAARLDAADAPALRATADVGIRWLLKAHPAPGLFVAQVGDERDHDLGFRDPAADDASGTPGIATRLAYPNMGGDLGGAAALALALAAERAPAEVAPSLIGAARDWYAAGVAADGPSPKLPAPAGDFYTGENANDALAAGAAALYRVTGERPYLDDALGRLGVQQLDGRLGWNALAGFAAADLCGALGAPAPANVGDGRLLGAQPAGRPGGSAVVGDQRLRHARLPHLGPDRRERRCRRAGRARRPRRRADQRRAERVAHRRERARLAARPQPVGGELRRRLRAEGAAPSAPLGLGEARGCRAGRSSAGRRR